jgi:hypothetical protein
VNRLLALGYLEREPLATDRRKFTYRVIYTSGDSLPSSKGLSAEIVCSDTNEDGGIVCRAPELSGCNETETDSQYISRREEIDSVETGKIDSVEAAHLAVRRLGKIEVAENVGAQLAILERAIKAGEQINAVEWYRYVGSVWEFEEHRGRADRLADELAGRMSPEEFEQCAVY